MKPLNFSVLLLVMVKIFAASGNQGKIIQSVDNQVIAGTALSLPLNKRVIKARFVLLRDQNYFN